MMEELKRLQRRYRFHKQSHGLVLGACLYASALSGVFQLRTHPAPGAPSDTGIEMEHEAGDSAAQAGRFVASRSERARGHLYRVNLADDQEADYGAAVLSPDRRHIAYTRCSLVQDVQDEEHGLCLADVSPRGRRQAAWAHGSRLLVPLEPRTLNSVTFCWLTDNRHVVFSARDWRREIRPAPFQGDLWLLDTEGGEVRRLTNTPDVSEFTPAASPDGMWIAFTRQVAARPWMRRDVFMVTTDGRQVRRVTTPENSPGLVHVFPRWSADGRFITFSSEGNRYRIPTDGSASAVRVPET